MNKLLGILLFVIIAVSSASIAFAYDPDVVDDGNLIPATDTYTINAEGFSLKTVQLVYSDGKTIDGVKPDGCGQVLDTYGFSANLPDGSKVPSFCADLGAHEVWGTYEIDTTGRGFTDEQKLHLVASLDYVNDLYDINTPEGYALCQILVWNAVIDTGDQGYAVDYRPGIDIVKIEGFGDWYTAEYSDVIDGILSGTIPVVDIYNGKLVPGYTGTFVKDIGFLVGTGDEAPINQQRQIFIIFGDSVDDFSGDDDEEIPEQIDPTNPDPIDEDLIPADVPVLPQNPSNPENNVKNPSTKSVVVDGDNVPPSADGDVVASAQAGNMQKTGLPIGLVLALFMSIFVAVRIKK